VAVLLLAGVVAVAPAHAVTYYATYKQNGGTATLTSQTITASATDTSAVWVANSGNLTMNNCTISTTGNTSSNDNSSFYGLNAGVLTTSGTLTMTGGTVTTTGTGANGIFAYSSSANVTVSGVTVYCSGQGGHAVMASGGGKMTVTNVNMTTTNTNAGAIATDRGSGTIAVTGGTVTTTGVDSPGIYSTGAITVSDATITATGSEAAVIEGSNSITLTNTSLSGAKKRGVMIYQSMSGDATGKTGTFTMTGGTLSATVGPLFYVTNSTGIISLTGVTASATSGTLVNASAGNWGTSGANGGIAQFTANGETLTGNMTCDSISSITAAMKSGTTLIGAINKAALTIDATSAWTANAASTLTSLANSGTVAFSAAGLTDTVTGSYTQASTGNLKILIGGASSFDTVAVTGVATLDGTLTLTLADGYSPDAGTTFTIMTFGSRSGEFATLAGPAANRFTVTYNTGNIVLTAVAPAPGDFDGDGDVDDTDLATFESCGSGPAIPYASGCEDADFDTDSDVDQADFGVFQRCISGEDTAAEPDCAD
jgi:hypothetical protein